jgi:hypothetical protein
MTYNFDPDRWLEREGAALERSYKSGRITHDEYHRLRAELDRRYEEMLKRLDGTYQLP